MTTFKDGIGRRWAIDLDQATVDRVKQSLSIDLRQRTAAKQLGRDTALLVNVLFACVEGEADRRGVDPESFAWALAAGDGKAILRATSSLLVEMEKVAA